MLSHYRNTFKYKKSLSIVDCTDFFFFSGLTKRNRASRDNVCELTSLLGQLEERCTGIAEFTGSNHVQASMFFSGLIFTTASQVVFVTANISFIFMYKFYHLLIGYDCSIPSYETVLNFQSVCLNP